ncbi:MAG TPA: rhodanese-like domain-containing protein [Verrucomicrobiales bacterium]|jgi:rhodanese-related sulfurtransferase|nr:rhodanese-like domain-containing protein [Verrucomicrobiales bacterium]
MKKLLSLIAIAVLAVNVQAGEYPDISIGDLEKAIKAGKVVVIDVNGAKSFTKRGHIPGAVSFTGAKDLAKQLEKSDKNVLVVAYCGGPTCSAYKRGASVAAELGFKNVKHLSAGISGWIKAGKKLEKN